MQYPTATGGMPGSVVVAVDMLLAELMYARGQIEELRRL